MSLIAAETARPVEPSLARRNKKVETPTTAKARKTSRRRVQSIPSQGDVFVAKRTRSNRLDASSSLRSMSARNRQPGEDYGSAEGVRERKPPVRKGWKGWVEVEVDVPQSATLIHVDVSLPIIGERRTRSGKSFDGIAAGNANWVHGAIICFHSSCVKVNAAVSQLVSRLPYRIAHMPSHAVPDDTCRCGKV